MITDLKSLADEYSKTSEGSWLNEFDWSSVPVKFKKLKNDVVGYHFFGAITLMEVCDANIIFDIYIHELRHVWQAKKHPFFYLIGKLLRFLIENDADAEEAKALNWITNKQLQS